MSELTTALKKERLAWLNKRGTTAGTGRLFRAHVVMMRSDPTIAVLKGVDWERLFADHAAADAADHAWRSPLQETLFQTDGIREPKTYTRPAEGSFGDDLEQEHESYEQIAFEFASIKDDRADADIRMRKAAEATAAAYTRIKSNDIKRRRAKGDDSVPVKDVTDDKWNPKAAE
jgi:hypothetical protein